MSHYHLYHEMQQRQRDIAREVAAARAGESQRGGGMLQWARWLNGVIAQRRLHRRRIERLQVRGAPQTAWGD